MKDLENFNTPQIVDVDQGCNRWSPCILSPTVTNDLDLSLTG